MCHLSLSPPSFSCGTVICNTIIIELNRLEIDMETMYPYSYTLIARMSTVVKRTLVVILTNSNVGMNVGLGVRPVARCRAARATLPIFYFICTQDGVRSQSESVSAGFVA